MPKQIFKIDQFHGGLNENSDPRDIAPNELAEATDMMVDRVGKIRMMGGTKLLIAGGSESEFNDGDIGNPQNVEIAPGYGLFQFSSDYQNGQYIEGDPGPVLRHTNYIALMNASVNNSSLHIYSDHHWGAEGGTWGIFPTGWNNGNERPETVFYYADGVLRFCDSNKSNGNGTLWYGVVIKTFFGDGITGWQYLQGFEFYGFKYARWTLTEASLTALKMKVEGRITYGYIDTNGQYVNPDENTIGTPVTFGLAGISVSKETYDSNNIIKPDQWTINVWSLFRSSDNTLRFRGDNITGFDIFCIVGDKILVQLAEEGAWASGDIVSGQSFDSEAYEYNDILTVKNVSSTSITFEEDITADDADEDVILRVIHNLSRSKWFDPDNPDWEFALSTLYDESKQESALYIPDQQFAPKDFLRGPVHTYQKFRINIWVVIDPVFSEGNFYENYLRVSGWRFYMRRVGTNNWYLQSEVDISKGKSDGSGDYLPWDEFADSQDSEGTIYYQRHPRIIETEYLDGPREIETYESMSGWDNEVDYVGLARDFNTQSTTFGEGANFKCAVLTNKVAYLGNVAIPDKQNSIKTFSDSVFKSRIGKYDSFSHTRRLDVNIHDGDSVMALEEFADRLLIFKRKTMYLLNVSQEVEFIEEVYKRKGVSHSAATCKTDFGVAWANRQGVYLYDGKSVINLLDKEGYRVINTNVSISGPGNAWWRMRDDIAIGYVPDKRQIIIVQDIGIKFDGDNDIYLYDLVTQSWVKGEDKMPSIPANGIVTDGQTNFITDWNNNLIVAYQSGTGYLAKWRDDLSEAEVTTSSNFSMKTKDIDFGQPGQRKKVYRVRISYKGDASAITVGYGFNGNGAAYEFNEAGTTPLINAGTTDWEHAELTPTTSSLVNNIYSFQLVFGGTAAADFEINDISIVFRLKSVK